jgi:hypothetical protein
MAEYRPPGTQSPPTASVSPDWGRTFLTTVLADQDKSDESSPRHERDTRLKSVRSGAATALSRGV